MNDDIGGRPVEGPLGDGGGAPPGDAREEPAGLFRTTWSARPHALDDALLSAERIRHLREAVRRLPGRCPELVTALLATPGADYAQLAEELALPRGSIGPLRSRCLGCLRRLLTPEHLRA